jgi:hypothetical protein
LRAEGAAGAAIGGDRKGAAGERTEAPVEGQKDQQEKAEAAKGGGAVGE